MSSAEIVRALKKNGFKEVRQRGSHLMLRHETGDRRVTVPVGKKDMPIGTARSILEEAGLDWKNL